MSSGLNLCLVINFYRNTGSTVFSHSKLLSDPQRNNLSTEKALLPVFGYEVSELMSSCAMDLDFKSSLGHQLV